MKAADVIDTQELALDASSCNQATFAKKSPVNESACLGKDILKSALVAPVGSRLNSNSIRDKASVAKGS